MWKRSKVKPTVIYCTVESGQFSLDTKFKRKTWNPPTHTWLLQTRLILFWAAEIWLRTKPTCPIRWTGQKKYHQLLSNSWPALNKAKPPHIHRHALSKVSINSHPHHIPRNMWSTNTSSSNVSQHLTSSLSPACSLNFTTDPGSAIGDGGDNEHHLGWIRASGEMAR